jgi:hypothetical protein
LGADVGQGGILDAPTFTVMKKGLPIAAAFLAVLLAGPTNGQASDHIDGPQTGLDLDADLTDFYSFTSPKDPSKLVLVLNVRGLATSRTMFSDALEYKFNIREVADAKTLKPGNQAQTITCTFQGGNLIDTTQDASCSFDLKTGKDVVTFQTRSDDYQAGGVGRNKDLSVFAGTRSDTWFLDLKRTVAFSNGENIHSKDGSNGLHGQNVLSIVVEMDKSRVGGPLLAVNGQTVRNGL